MVEDADEKLSDVVDTERRNEERGTKGVKKGVEGCKNLLQGHGVRRIDVAHSMESTRKCEGVAGRLMRFGCVIGMKKLLEVIVLALVWWCSDCDEQTI